MTFFHGTRRGFTRGGYLMPRSMHAGEGTDAPLSPGRTQPAKADTYVYVTTSKTLAWVYAWHAPGRGKPKVLTVLPFDPLETDPEHSHDMQAYRCSMARVISVDTDPEITEEEAREGWASV